MEINKHYFKANVLFTQQNTQKLLLIVSCCIFTFATFFDVFIQPTSCYYCLLQRALWSIIALLNVFSIVFSINKIFVVNILFISALLLTAGALVAIFQTFYYYNDIGFCLVNNPAGNKELLSCMQSPIIFNLPLAFYNLLLNLLMLMFLLISVFYNVKKI